MVGPPVSASAAATRAEVSSSFVALVEDMVLPNAKPKEKTKKSNERMLLQ